MNYTMKRRPYAAPSAELICLAPSTPIASWQWKDNGKHNWNSNSWGDDPIELFGAASITGVAEWLDDATQSENPDFK